MAKRPESLSGKFKGSFAFQTLSERVPHILTGVINHLYHVISDIQSPSEETSYREALSQISKLKYELERNRPLIPFSLGEDLNLWNNRIAEAKKGGYFDVSWLFAECYVYRKIHEIFLEQQLSKFDPFEKQKKDVFNNSLGSIRSLSLFLYEYYETQGINKLECFNELIHFSLWGNQTDLSLHHETSNQKDDFEALQKHTRDHLEAQKKFILIDDTEKIINHLVNTVTPKRVDIILDNSGPELFSDLCLADFLISEGFALEVHFHMKCFGWFVSDVTLNDLLWTLEECSNFKEDQTLQYFGNRWKKFIDNKSWILKDHPFWTCPDAFWEMKKVAKDLHDDLSNSTFLFFKGDLNYRKLTYDCKWDPTTSFQEALGEFPSTSLAALRTLKADVIVGLKPGQAEETSTIDPHWMTNGTYGVIQFNKL